MENRANQSGWNGEDRRAIRLVVGWVSILLSGMIVRGVVAEYGVSDPTLTLTLIALWVVVIGSVAAWMFRLHLNLGPLEPLRRDVRVVVLLSVVAVVIFAGIAGWKERTARRALGHATVEAAALARGNLLNTTVVRALGRQKVVADDAHADAILFAVIALVSPLAIFATATGLRWVQAGRPTAASDTRSA